MKTLLKEGDKVRVKYVKEGTDDCSPEGYEDTFIDKMSKYCGRTFVVSSVDEDGCIKLSDRFDFVEAWNFVEEWLEKVD